MACWFRARAPYISAVADRSSPSEAESDRSMQTYRSPLLAWRELKSPYFVGLGKRTVPFPSVVIGVSQCGGYLVTHLCIGEPWVSAICCLRSSQTCTFTEIYEKTRVLIQRHEQFCDCAAQIKKRTSYSDSPWSICPGSLSELMEFDIQVSPAKLPGKLTWVGPGR